MSSFPRSQSIPEALRILGSLGGILLLFVLTAVLVRVEMSPHAFFSVTMASVWFINCESVSSRGPLFPPLFQPPSLWPSWFQVLLQRPSFKFLFRLEEPLSLSLSLSPGLPCRLVVRISSEGKVQMRYGTWTFFHAIIHDDNHLPCR